LCPWLDVFVMRADTRAPHVSETRIELGAREAMAARALLGRPRWSLRHLLLNGPVEKEVDEIRLARLSLLSLPKTPCDREMLKKDLGDVMRFAKLVQNACVEKVQLPWMCDDETTEPTPLREDRVTEEELQQQVLANASHIADGQFLVRKGD